MILKAIIIEKLKEIGADALVQPECECCCLLDDLIPCGESPLECYPGKDGFNKQGEPVVYQLFCKKTIFGKKWTTKRPLDIR